MGRLPRAFRKIVIFKRFNKFSGFGLKRRCMMVFAALAIMGAVNIGAQADQTDKRLDSLFKELRTGGTVNADANVDRILEIWADSQSDTVDVIYNRALGLYHEGDLKGASLLLTYTRALSPNFMQAYALSGFVKLQDNNQSGALDDFSRAITLEPRQFEVRKALAQLLLASDAKREAYDMIQKALEWNPYDEDLLRMSSKLITEFEGQDI